VSEKRQRIIKRIDLIGYPDKRHPYMQRVPVQEKMTRSLLWESLKNKKK
jgi:hypothetical protein